MCLCGGGGVGGCRGGSLCKDGFREGGGVCGMRTQSHGGGGGGGY